MKSYSRLSVSFAVAVTTMLMFQPVAALADWVDNNCVTSGDYGLSSWTKSQAKNYALVALHEGYHWGGGCWNNNDRDDSPNEPLQQTFPRGEGPDCSGFTFKTWALVNSYGGPGKHFWLAKQYIHGPYSASSFYSAPGTPFSNVSNSSANVMDAFASTSHTGMIWTANTSQGQDTIIEAKGEAYGVVRATRNYRSQVGTFKGVRRQNWG